VPPPFADNCKGMEAGCPHRKLDCSDRINYNTTYMLNQWFKFYGLEFLSDLKIKKLNAEERSCLVTLFCYVSVSAIPGVIENLSEATLKTEAGCPNYKKEVYKLLENLKIIKIINEDTIEVCNWMKRQGRASTTSERVQKYRLKRKLGGSTQGNVTDVTNSNERANAREEEIREDKKREDIVTSLSSSKSESRTSKKQRLNGGYSVVFETFWSEYPNKVAKGKAYETFILLNADIQEQCVAAIKKQNENNHFWKDWVKNEDGTVGADSPPHATTWLNQKRWEDVVKFIERKGKSGGNQQTFKTYG